MTGKITFMASAVRKLVHIVGDILISSLLTVVVGPILVLLWVVNELIRRIVIAPLLRIFHGRGVALVADGADNVWSYKKFGNSRNILMLIVYKEKIDPEKYQRSFLERVLDFVGTDGQRPFLKLRKMYVKRFGYNCWADDEKFDANNHVKVLDPNWGKLSKEDKSQFLNADPSSTILTESNVLKLLRDLSGDMEKGKPQWEDIIIPNFVYDHEVEPESGTNTLKLKEGHKIRSARIFRCHHAYMDGASVLLITSKCMTDGEFPYSTDPLAPIEMNRWDKFCLFFRSIFFGVKVMLRTVVVAAVAKNRFVTRKFQGNSYHVWSPPIPLSTVLRIKTLYKSSFTAILTTIHAGAVRELEEQYPAVKAKTRSWRSHDKEEEDEDEKHYSKPKDKILMGMIGAVGPYPDISPRNRYTVVNFHANTSACPRLRRLELITRKMKKLSSNEDFLVNLWLFQFFGKFPAFFVQSMMKNGGSPIVISNTPWARSRVTLMGDEVEELGGWVPLLAYSGVGILIARYCDTLRFCGVAEQACLSEEHLKFFVGAIEKEIYGLAQDCDAAMKKAQIMAINMEV